MIFKRQIIFCVIKKKYAVLQNVVERIVTVVLNNVVGKIKYVVEVNSVVA